VVVVSSSDCPPGPRRRYGVESPSAQRHRALELRDRFEEVQPGYHMNKKHWNTVVIEGAVPGKELRSMIDHSYELVVQSLRRREREKLKLERAAPAA